MRLPEICVKVLLTVPAIGAPLGKVTELSDACPAGAAAACRRFGGGPVEI
jgi:hypothetical protein